MNLRLFAALCAAILFPVPLNTAAAQDPGEIAKLRRELQALTANVKSLTATVAQQQKVIDQLIQREPTQSSDTKTANQAPTTTRVDSSPSPGSGNRIAGLNFNPDIGVVGDIVGTAAQSDDDEGGNDRISLRELELVIGHDVDPYSRFDATIAFSDEEDPHVEEGFLTYWGLPAGFLGRLGRIRPKVGLTAPLHRDSLDTVDEPLVVTSLFGEEGYSRSGVELSNFLPTLQNGLTQEVLFGLLEGGSGHGATAFGESRNAPTFYTRLRNSVDISDTDTADLGATYLGGSADDDSAAEVHIFGADISLSHYFDPIRRLRFQNEIYIQNRSLPAVESDHEDEGDGHTHAGDAEESDSPYRQNPLGFYSLIDYRLGERWGVGGRFDYNEAVNLDTARSIEKAYSAYLTFYQSEFARLRFQYQYAELLDGLHDDRFFLQATVAIGTHKHAIK